MGKQLGKLEDRKIFLRKIKFRDIITDTDADINYKLNMQYKIVENKNGVVNIKVKVYSLFVPEFLFKSSMDFNVVLEFEKEVENEDIISNIEELMDPVASEVSYLLGTITKSMNNNIPLILPPVIDDIKLIEE
ncbi:hypothetical protein CSBG_01024 [Clostridium sp. 7_2_43FAA]|uniref:hypothetical protein n=1 Tax=Clostridium TaxID=1485 RepID=UPI00019AFF9B|nr:MULTISPECIES: hypothetical protein [Clostridium]EEH97398.1 hypothetical protein CSBG_01024 [Clostridium sp. 7_2_43FAA]